MTLKCDHCRQDLGHSIRRYCQMRFCSPACVEAYRRRLDDETKLKIQRLDFLAVGNPQKPDYRRLGGFVQRLPR
jgi:hypothetical protein